MLEHTKQNAPAAQEKSAPFYGDVSVVKLKEADSGEQGSDLNV